MSYEAIWKRRSGPNLPTPQSSSMFTAYPGEKVYALMGFFLKRIRPNPAESEDEAFTRLMNENGLLFDHECLLQIAYGEIGRGEVGIQMKQSRREGEYQCHFIKLA